MSDVVFKKALSAMESGVKDASKEFEDALLAKVALRVGARVRRGRDWVWSNQDFRGQGSVVEYEYAGGPCKVAVKWDLIQVKYWYRWGNENAFDVLPTDPASLDVSALTDDERAYVRTYGLLSWPGMSDVLVQAIGLSESGGCGIGDIVVPPSNATPRPRVRSGMSSEGFRRFKEAMERQLRVDKPAKEPAEGERATVSEAFQHLSEAVDRLRQPEETEGERLARFFATSEHDRVRADEGFEVTEVRLSDASEPRNELRDVLMMESPTSPGYVERLYDAMATDAYRREEDRRAAELRETVAAIRDDFDNLPDAR